MSKKILKLDSLWCMIQKKKNVHILGGRGKLPCGQDNHQANLLVLLLQKLWFQLLLHTLLTSRILLQRPTQNVHKYFKCPGLASLVLKVLSMEVV
jgi:hypothetical protein